MVSTVQLTTDQLKQLVSLLDLELRRTGLASLQPVVDLHNVLVPALAAAQAQEQAAAEAKAQGEATETEDTSES